jgi:uncharacterized integral membrane protein
MPTMNRIKLIAVALGTILVVVVIAQNTQEVQTQVLWMRLSMPRAVLLIGALLVGFGFGVVFGDRLRRRR